MAGQDSQKQLADIWARHLGVRSVTTEDNFFALGGHSLLGVKMIGAIQDRFGLGDELKLSDLFEHPTLGEFSDHLQTLLAPSEETGEI